MDIFQKEIQELCDAFNKNDVRYLLVGGFAVNYHGYSRATGDLDLWIDDSESNKQKLLSALDKLGYETNELKQEDQYAMNLH